MTSQKTVRGYDVFGKRCAVTGGGGGIGRALCVAMAASGALAILAMDVDKTAADETAKLCRAAATNPAFVAAGVYCDAASTASLSTA
jgi:NAD(P)-dependent dehydrogenase (short-subunit alcohol dehydrogenase family)